MPIYNVCCKCGRKIQTRDQKDQYLRRMLSSTNTAMCKLCEPNSSWALVNPIIYNEGRINYWSYQEIVTEVGVGLLLKTKQKEIYFPPLASKKELENAFFSLPEYIRIKLVEYPLIKKIFE